MKFQSNREREPDQQPLTSSKCAEDHSSKTRFASFNRLVAAKETLALCFLLWFFLSFLRGIHGKSDVAMQV